VLVGIDGGGGVLDGGGQLPEVDLDVLRVEPVAVPGPGDRVGAESVAQVVPKLGDGGVEASSGIPGPYFRPDRGHELVAGGAFGGDGEVDEQLQAVRAADP
jgi:hypothetical protein